MTLHNLQLVDLHENVYVQGSIQEFNNRNTVLTIHNADTDELIVTATVQIPESIIIEALFIKDYGDSEGVFDWLVENNIIEPYEEMDHVTEKGIERGAMLIDENILDEVKKLKTDREKQDYKTFHVSDDEGNTIFKEDGVTPITFVFHKDEVKTIEQNAEENNLTMTEAIINYLEVTTNQ